MTTIKSKGHKKVRFNLPPNQTEKNRVKWRRSPRSRSWTEPLPHGAQKYWKHAKRKKCIEGATKRDVLNGTIPSAISDTGDTSTAGKESDPFIPTDEVSQKAFYFPTGNTAKSGRVAKLHHQLREPARTVEIVPGIDSTILSARKCVDAGYIQIYDKDEATIYDSKTVTIIVS